MSNLHVIEMKSGLESAGFGHAGGLSAHGSVCYRRAVVQWLSLEKHLHINPHKIFHYLLLQGAEGHFLEEEGGTGGACWGDAISP